MKHDIHIKDYDSLKDLAEDIGNLRYDALQLLLEELTNKLERDYEADKGRGYDQLACGLYQICSAFRWAARSAEKVWKISKPKMKPEDLEGTPS